MRSETRLLSLLGMFASGRTYSASELAAHFGVTSRTIRRDITGLRELGYVVGSVPGTDGGYRAESRTVLPPLQLGAGEALATAVGLALLRGAGLDTDHADSATEKLRTMLPAAMRSTVADIAAAVAVPEGNVPGVDIGAVITLASAINASTIATFDYRKQRRAQGVDPTALVRRVEPIRLVVFGAHWYLYAWDRDRADHRVFRLDRMSDVHATTLTFPFRDHPDAEAAVTAAVTIWAYPHTVILRTDASADRAKEWFSTRSATVTEVADGVRITFGFEDLRWVAATLATVPGDIEILHPPELIDMMRTLAERAGAVVDASSPHAESRPPVPPGGGPATPRGVAQPPPRSN
jgi:predicted DNA-binding transcriptional regulator YafY